jgi:hypothetical protein
VCRGRDFASLRDTAIIRVLFDTGCRRGELVNLTLADWDRRQDFLTLRGKTGLRVVPISATTGEALARYVRARSNHSATGPTDALWLGRKGALRDSGVSQLLAYRCRLARLPRINPARIPPHVQPRVPGSGRLGGRPHVYGRLEVDGDGSPLRRQRRGTTGPGSPPAHRSRRPDMTRPVRNHRFAQRDAHTSFGSDLCFLDGAVAADSGDG